MISWYQMFPKISVPESLEKLVMGAWRKAYIDEHARRVVAVFSARGRVKSVPRE